MEFADPHPKAISQNYILLEFFLMPMKAKPVTKMGSFVVLTRVQTSHGNFFVIGG